MADGPTIYGRGNTPALPVARPLTECELDGVRAALWAYDAQSTVARLVATVDALQTSLASQPIRAQEP